MKKTTRKAIACLLALTLIVPMFASTAFATSEAATSNEIGNGSLPSVWGIEGKATSYTVTESCTIQDRIDVKGDVTLTLNDGVELTLPTGIHLVAGNSLTVNSQSHGERMGKLTATGVKLNAAIGGNMGSFYTSLNGNDGEDCGTLTVFGGVITACGSGDGRGFGGGTGGFPLSIDDSGGNGGDGGSLSVFGGVCLFSSEYGYAVGGGLGCDGFTGAGEDGAATALTLGEKISALAGTDEWHLTDTEYTDQHCVKFGQNALVTFTVSGAEPFTKAATVGLPVDDPWLSEGDDYIVWYTDSDCTKAYDFSQAVTGDMTLYGAWVSSPTDYEYTSWDAQGNATVKTHCFSRPMGSRLIHRHNLPTVWKADGSENWYVVTESCTIAERVNIEGDINLILADGAELTLPKGIRLVEGNSLSVYSQSQEIDNMGRLTATGFRGSAAIGGNVGLGDSARSQGGDGENCGTLTVFGGMITAIGSGDGRGFGGGQGGYAVNYGGNGGDGGSLSILGGVSVISSEIGAAIGGGTDGSAKTCGMRGAQTALTLGAKISTQAGTNELTDTEYIDQHCARFGQNALVTFTISGADSFTEAVIKGFPVYNPWMTDGEGYAVWYTDSDCTKAYDFSLPVMEDMTLYGVWTLLPSNIYQYTSWDTDGNPTVDIHVFQPDGPRIIRRDNLPTSWKADGYENWYVVAESCTIEERVEIIGDINLILADGAELTLPKGIRLVAGNSLTVYSQSQGGTNMGKLTATGTDGNAAIGGNAGLGYSYWEFGNDGDFCGALTVGGGVITAMGLGNSRGFGGGEGGLANNNGGDGGAGGNLVILGGASIFSSKNGAAVGGGTHGFGDCCGRDGAATTLTLSEMVSVQAGVDAEHATDTEYTDQHYVQFVKAHSHTVDGNVMKYTEWKSTNSLPTSSGNYFLTSDVTLTDTWGVPMNVTINLCLNGHVIKQATNGKKCISVSSFTTLNLHDCNGDNCTHDGYVDGNGLWHLGAGTGTGVSITGGVITGGTDGGVYVYNGGRFNVYGGTIAGNKKSGNGGAVYNEGVFNMYGGAIRYNTASGGGGGLYTTSAYNTMHGGMISNNKSMEGGGVKLGNGGAVFEMFNGEIGYNRAISGHGGGVDVNWGTFKMHGGSINNNYTNAWSGAGVWSNANVIIGGSSVIKDNHHGSSVNNLRVTTDHPVEIGTGSNGVEAPTKDMSVGIILKGDTGAFTKACSDYSASFISDNKSVKVVYKNGVLVLETVSSIKRDDTAHPTEPDKPTKPDNSSEQKDPVNPTNPVNPTEQTSSSSAAASKTSSYSSPKTGDSGNMTVWFGALAVSFAVCVVCLISGRKKKKD